MTLSDYLSLFPGSSREKTRLVELASLVLQQVMDLKAVIGSLNAAYSVGGAEGTNLDEVAASFGLYRADTVDGQSAADEVFRQYLLAKLNLWQWDGTNEGVPAILEKIQPGSEQSDNGDGTVTAVPGGTLPGEIGKLFPVPAGVRVIHN